MSDIVDRLRFLASGQDDAHSVAITEAADTISQMRDAMRTVAVALHEAGHTPQHGKSLADAVRAAIAAQPGPLDALRKALMVIDKHSVATIRTNSKDRGDWAEDMAYVGKVAREALATAPDAQKGAQPRQVDAWNAGKETGQAAERKAAAQECLSILLDGRYWNGAPQIAYQGASDRAAEIRRVFGL